MDYKYLFGPVPSRRLGISLGIDLVPLKTCTLNCVYCECGRTTDLTVARKEYVPVADVIKELDHYLSQEPHLDFITFAGSGEPTLHGQIHQIIDFVKDRYPQFSLCLLTNGTLFTLPSVRSQVKRVDLIIPSLDAATEKGFQAINRPHSQLNLAEIITGLANLRLEYDGEIRLEIFIVPGLNDTEEELAEIKKAVHKINPDRIQVGSLDRPGAEGWVREAPRQQLLEIAAYLGEAEIVEDYRPQQATSSRQRDYEGIILQTLKRRPCTVEDLHQILNLRPAEVQKYTRQLLAAGQIQMVKKKRGVFLQVKK